MENNICFMSNNYLSQIIIFLEPCDIIKLSLSSHKLNELLSPENNSIVNTLFLFLILDEFFENEKYNENTKKNILEKNIKFCSNFKQVYRKFKENFYKYQNKTIKNLILNFLKIHIYLPDLRKDNFILDFEKSSIHELFCYDINQRTIDIYNYYSKYINIDSMIIRPEKNIKIKILRENLEFEDCLINFIEIFDEYKFNNIISNFVNNYILNYDYEYLYKIQNNVDISIICKNKLLNDIINFVIWINHIFILYCKFNYEYIHGLLHNFEKDEIIKEFILKKNDLINCALLINSAFENINIVLNFLSIYKSIYDDYTKKNIDMVYSLSNLSTNSKINISISDFNIKNYLDMIISPKNKFYLYNLFSKSINHYYTKQLGEISDIFLKLSKDYFKELFTIDSQETNNNHVLEDKMDDNDEIEDEICSDDDCISLGITLSKKELIENMMNSFADDYINSFNVNAINHTFLRINKSYIDIYENGLIKVFENQIIESINKDKIDLDICFNKIEKLTRVESNSKNLCSNPDSLAIIRRSKKLMMKNGYSVIFSELIELLSNDFYERIKNNRKLLFLNVTEKNKSKIYKCNLDVLSEKGENNVIKNVENECEKVERYLINKYKLSIDENHLVREYIESNQIEFVFLLKKILWNYYKQLEIYKERDEMVRYYLFNDKNKINNTVQNEGEYFLIKNNETDEDREKKELWKNTKQ